MEEKVKQLEAIVKYLQKQNQKLREDYGQLTLVACALRRELMEAKKDAFFSR